MEVIHATDSAQSVTIGQTKSHKMSMVSDPSLMLLLSKSLYTNQKLAPVRELITNGWDNHIECGVTDKPLLISISPEYVFTVRNFGSGIPTDMLPAIYGTYGASTKKDKLESTGGFGLGSKSPFAYTSTFTVVNTFEGTSTTYLVSEGSANNNNEPSIDEIITVRNGTEDGMTVMFQLENEYDAKEFATYIRAICMHGDIKAIFTYRNNEPEELKRIGLSSEPGSFKMTNTGSKDTWWFNYMGNHNIYIRYGAVIYPMLVTPRVTEAYTILDKLRSALGAGILVIQAAPGTITLQPGRETLSSSRLTEQSLIDLCIHTVNKMESDLEALVPSTFKATLELMATPPESLKNAWEYEGNNILRTNQVDLFTTAIADHTMRYYLSSSLGFKYIRKYAHAIEETYQKMLRSVLGSEGRWDKTLRATVSRNALMHTRAPDMKTEYPYSIMTRAKLTILQECFFKRFCKVSSKAPDGITLSYKNLYLVTATNTADTLSSVMSMRNYLTVNYTEIAYKRILFIARTSQKSSQVISDYITHTKGRDASVGENSMGYLMYVTDLRVGTKSYAAMVRHLRNYYDVIDLSDNYSWDSIAAVRIARKQSRKSIPKTVSASVPRKVGKSTLPVLSSLFRLESNPLNWESEVIGAAIMHPLGKVKLLAYAESKRSLKNYAKFLTEDEMSRMTYVSRGVETNMAKRRGAVPIADYIASKLYKEYMEPAFLTYLQKYRRKDIGEIYCGDSVYLSSAMLRLLRALKCNMKEYDATIYNPRYELLINNHNHMFHTNTDPERVEAAKAVSNAIDTLVELPKLVTQVRALSAVDIVVALGGLRTLSKLHTENRVVAEKFFPLIRKALKSVPKDIS